MSRYVCVCVCVAKTNLRSQTEMERLNFASKNWRGLVMDGTTANCCLAPGRRTSTASRGREDMCVYVCVCVEARVAARCWVAPTTLNGNASLGAALHGPTDGGRYVCVVTPAVCVCVCVVLGRSMTSSCGLAVQLPPPPPPPLTSPDRTGSHALLIQSPPPSRAIEPISEDSAPC